MNSSLNEQNPLDRLLQIYTKGKSASRCIEKCELQLINKLARALAELCFKEILL